MDQLKVFDAIEALAERARMDSPPATNVKFDMAMLEPYQRQQSYLFPMAWSAGLSLAAACLAIFLMLHSSASASAASTDSVSPLFAPTQVEMP